MTKHVAVLLILLEAACTPDGQQVATSTPAAEAFDLSQLNGKAIRIEIRDTLDSDNETTAILKVVGKTIVWGDLQFSTCAFNGVGLGSRLAFIYVLDQPRTGTKVPCEAESHYFMGGMHATSPSDVQYSSSMSLHGNMLELSGQMTEHAVGTHGRTAIHDEFTSSSDITNDQHVKVRLSANKCEVVDFSWMLDVRNRQSNAVGMDRTVRRYRATGCSIGPP